MRIVTAQLNYKIGDFAGNFAKIAAQIEHYAATADMIVFSELCLSGYYPRDLILQSGFLPAQNAILEKITALTLQFPISVVVGFVEKNTGKGQPYHNSLTLIHRGKRLFTYHKRLLPVYNIFNEARHFAPGNQPGICSFQGLKFGFLICEDGWAGMDNYLYAGDPVDDLMAKSLDAIICINGSPSNLGKQHERLHRFTAIAKRCQAPLIFSNQVGGNDDIVFDGASFVCDKEGKLLGSLKAFTEDTGTIVLNKNHIEITSDYQAYHEIPEAEFFYEQILLGLKDYVRKSIFNKVVIGLSGGIDSALTLAVAVKALGANNVSAITMPSRYSSKGSITDSEALCKTLQVKLYTRSIEEEFTLALTQFKQVFGETPSALTEQNIQARLRGRILMEYSNQTGALVLSTGNKSELSVGYTTLYGDMTGGFNIIGDLYKTEVYKLAHYFNQRFPETPIPQAILDKVPSAELAPNQKDSDTLPEYAILDPILKLYIEGDLLPKHERREYHALLKDICSAYIHKVHQLVDAAEFKRRQSPPIVRVQRRAFGFGRQFPIAATYPKIDPTEKTDLT